MRKLCLIIPLIFGLASKAQDEEGFVYYFTKDVRLQEFDFNKKQVKTQNPISTDYVIKSGDKEEKVIVKSGDPEYQTALRWQKFVVVDDFIENDGKAGALANKSKKDYVVIQFLNFGFNQRSADKEYIDYDDNGKYFLLEKALIDKVTAKSYNKGFIPSISTAVIPIKARPGRKKVGKERPFDYATDVTLGFNVGVRQRLSHFKPYYMNYVAGFGITSINVDSVSTKGGVTKSSTMSGLTPSIGLLFEFYSAQVGLFAGLDYLAKEAGRNWIYQGKPWFSVGIGFQMLKRESVIKNTQPQSK